MINGERRPAIHLLHGSSLSSCQLFLSLSPPLDPPTPPSSPATRQEVAVINAFDVPPSPIVMEFFFFFFESPRKKTTHHTQKTSFSLVLELDSLQEKKKKRKKKVMDEVVKFRSQLVSASLLAASILSFIPVETHRRVSRSN